MATIDNEKHDAEINPIDRSISTVSQQHGNGTELALQPAGLVTMTAIKSSWNAKSLALAWGGAIAVSFALAFDQNTSGSFFPYATSDFNELSLLGTIGTIQNVLAAVMQQPLARLADVYGRFELFCACILIVTVGQIMMATSTTIQVFAASQIFFVIGILGLILMLQFLAGDSSDLKNRMIMSAIPLFPLAISSWTAAPIVTAILENTSWRWGYGIFAILFPVLSVPLLGTLWWNQRKVTKTRKFNGTYRPSNHWLIFQQLDPIGFILFAGGLSLVLLPLSLAASTTTAWRTPHIIVMIVVGVSSLIAFGIWEVKFAKWPILPMDLFVNRTVIFGSAASLMDYVSMYSFQSYFFIYMIVYSNISVAAATNVGVIQPFVATFGLLGSGFLLKYLGRPKWIIIAGFCVNILGMGLTLAYRDASRRIAPLLTAQGIFGLGQGMIYPVQTAMQASVNEESMAQVTALFTTIGACGSAFGAAISAGVWTNVLPQKLQENLPASAQSLLGDIVDSADVIFSFEWGSPERVAINTSYDQTMRILLIIGVCAQVIGLLLSLFIADLNFKTIDETRDYGGIVIGKTGVVDAVKERVRNIPDHATERKDIVE